MHVTEDIFEVESGVLVFIDLLVELLDLLDLLYLTHKLLSGNVVDKALSDGEVEVQVLPFAVSEADGEKSVQEVY